MHNLQNACFDDRPALNVKLITNKKPPCAIRLSVCRSSKPAGGMRTRHEAKTRMTGITTTKSLMLLISFTIHNRSKGEYTQAPRWASFPHAKERTIAAPNSISPNRPSHVRDPASFQGCCVSSIDHMWLFLKGRFNKVLTAVP